MKVDKILRLYQSDALSFALGLLYDGERIGGIIMPTGSGKSLVVQSIIGYVLQYMKNFTHIIVAAPQGHIKDSFEIKGTSLKIKTNGLDYQKSYSESSIIEVPFPWIEKIGGPINDLRSFIKSQKPKGFLITTHQTLALSLSDEDLVPENCEGFIIFIDEAHRLSDITQEDKELATKITKFCKTIEQRGGTVFYITATPYRGDNIRVMPEDCPHFIWSIADHMNAGYAPKNIESSIETLKGYEARSIKEILGEEAPKNIAVSAENQIVIRWEKDGKPKLIIVVPSIGSGYWSKRLVNAFIEYGVPKDRIFNAVGKNKQTRLKNLLEKENSVKNYCDLNIDIIIACKRFDEGTDWVAASHIYQIGISKTIKVIVQRGGRTMRCKYEENDLESPKFPGMPQEHLNSSVRRYFMPEGATKLYDDFWSQHHNHVILVAAYMADSEIGNMFIKINEKLFSKLDKRKRSGNLKLNSTIDRLKQVVKIDDISRAKALAEIYNAKMLLGTNGSLEESFSIISSYFIQNKYKYSHEEFYNICLILAEEASIKNPNFGEEWINNMERILFKNINKRRVQKTEITPELIEAFNEISNKFKNITLMTRNESRYISKFTNQDITEINKEIQNKIKNFTKLDLKIEREYKEKGAYPRKTANNQWIEWDSWLKRNNTKGGLPEYLKTRFGHDTRTSVVPSNKRRR